VRPVDVVKRRKRVQRRKRAPRGRRDCEWQSAGNVHWLEPLRTAGKGNEEECETRGRTK
jgi:hypothetical protein